MLKHVSLGLAALSFSAAVCAAGFGAQDAGVYEIVTVKDNKPAQLSGIQMRLYQQKGHWLMDGKDQNVKGENKDKWINVCGAANGCEFKPSSKKQMQAIFPDLKKMEQTDAVGCIQNKIQAMCRLDSKVNKGYVGYMMVALGGKKPTVMLLQRQQ